MPEIQGLNVSRKYYDAAVSYSQNFNRDINSIDYLGDTINNPYSLSDADIELLGLYYSGKNFFRDADQQRLTNALQKYQSAQEWYSQMQQQIANTEYNSEVGQVVRQSEAGLNPDLQGVDVSSAAATGVAQPSSPDLSAGPGTGDQTLDLIDSVFGTVGTILSATNAIGSTVLQGFHIFQSLRNSRAEYASKLLNDILPGVVNSLPESAFASDEAFSSVFNEELFTGLGFSKSDFRQSQNWLSSLKRSPSQLRQLFSNKSDYEKFRQNYGELLLSPFRWSPDSANENLKKLQALKFDQMISSYDAKVALDRFDAAYNIARNPDLAAEAFDSQSRQTINQEQLQGLQLDYEMARMRAVLPQIIHAAELIETGDPANVFEANTILADILNPSNNLWSFIGRELIAVSDTLEQGVSSLSSGTTESGVILPQSGRFFREISELASQILRGAEAEFYGISWKKVKDYFNGVKNDFVDDFKKRISSPSSGSLSPNMLDSYNHFYGW